MLRTTNCSSLLYVSILWFRIYMTPPTKTKWRMAVHQWWNYHVCKGFTCDWVVAFRHYGGTRIALGCLLQNIWKGPAVKGPTTGVKWGGPWPWREGPRHSRGIFVVSCNGAMMVLVTSLSGPLITHYASSGGMSCITGIISLSKIFLQTHAHWTFYSSCFGCQTF